MAIPIEYPQEKALLPLNKCPPPHITHTHRPTHPETKSVGEESKEINRLHAQPAKSHPTNVPPTLQSAYYLLLTNRSDRSTDTTQKEEQNNSYNVPSARTRAEQHK